MTYRYRASNPTTTTQEIGVSPRRTPTLPLPVVSLHPTQAREQRRAALAAPTPPAITWAPAPRRSRPGRAPLMGEAAVVGRYLQRHLDEGRDDVLTARVVLSHLMPAVADRLPEPVLVRATSVVCSLRQQGGPWLARVDAPCPGEACGTRVVQGPVGPQDELCEEHWEALGGWLSVQAVHVRSLLTLAGVAQ